MFGAPKTVIAQRLAPAPVHLAAVGLLLLTGCASLRTPKDPAMAAKLAPAKAHPPFTPLNLDTPIETICAQPAGKAVLDRDLPGLTTRPEFAMFKAMTLKQLQPMSQGRMTDTALARVQADLKAVNAKAQGK